MIKKIVSSKSIWGAWFAFSFGILILFFATADIKTGTILLLSILGITVPIGVGLLIMWVDFAALKDTNLYATLFEINPDVHFVKGFISQFGGIIFWLTYSSTYGIRDWFTPLVNLMVFLASTFAASIITVNIMQAPATQPPIEEEKITHGN